MGLIQENLKRIKDSLPTSATLVAVSKTKPIIDLEEAYQAGQRHFGENKVQELVQKHEQLPSDIKWHFIGHLQSKKAKQIVPFVHLIHGVDSLKLANEINKRAITAERTINILLQVKIAEEDSKFGISGEDLDAIAKEIKESCSHVKVCGLMGMATNTNNEDQVAEEFSQLRTHFKRLKDHLFNESNQFNTLSMGMTGDYKIAINNGSTMVRVGSAIFGERNYAKT